MINPSNEFLVESIVMLVKDLNRNHNAFLYDVYMALKKERDKAGEDYPRCGTCSMPAAGITRGCAECRRRHPDSYNRAYNDECICRIKKVSGNHASRCPIHGEKK